MRKAAKRAAQCVGAALLLWVLLGLTPKPMLLNKPGFSQSVYDENGNLLRISITSDEKFRLWVPLSKISKSMIDATLLKEDRLFYFHPGINPYALVRAVGTILLGDRQKLGASTITMQVARMRFGINSRTVGGKLLQIAHAIQLERHFSKKEILEAYLNLAPYGGNIEGVGAAAHAYFGKEASELTLPEALTLSVIPQHPGARIPHPEKSSPSLEEARRRLLLRTVDEPSGELQGIQITNRREDIPFEAPHFVQRVLGLNPFASRLKTTLVRNIQHVAEREVKSFLERNKKLGIENASVMVVDSRTMNVRGYVGSADFFNETIRGYVDGVQGRRSPGSALKPFIYGLAIDEGLIHPESILKDVAFGRSTYNPENFDKDFLGPISATDALIRSRNMPAISLANKLHPPGLYGFLKKAGIKDMREEGFYGLALALGGVEVRLDELTELYAMLLNGGKLRRLRFIEAEENILPDKEAGRVDAEDPEIELLSPEAAELVVQMLEKNPRPSNDFQSNRTRDHVSVAWKTGTSYGFRDAWAMGMVGSFVIGVWIGNFDGRSNPAFVGREAAGPLFFSIVDALRADGTLRQAPPAQRLNVKKIKVCAVSGQLPGPFCHHLKDALFIPGKSPIGTCTVHREVLIDAQTGLRSCPELHAATRREVLEFWPSDLLKLFHTAGIGRRVPPRFDPRCQQNRGLGQAPEIFSPRNGLSYALRMGEGSSLPFSAVTDAESRLVYWFVDDKAVGTAPSGETFFWPAQPGNFIVRAVDEQGRATAEELKVVLSE